MTSNSASLNLPGIMALGTPWRAAPLDDSPGGGLRWVMRRNCSLAPRQVLAAYFAFCLVSLSIACVFAWFGAVPVLYFAGLELLLLGAALLVYARHAADHETITLKNSTLAVEHHCGNRVERSEFRAAAERGDAAIGGERLAARGVHPVVRPHLVDAGSHLALAQSPFYRRSKHCGTGRGRFGRPRRPPAPDRRTVSA